MELVDLSIIVPCYRDEKNISELLVRLYETLGSLNLSYEVIYINDDSPDNSQSVLEEKLKEYPNLKVLKHSRNFGLMNVYLTGMRVARSKAVVLMDGDLQDPPELIKNFVEQWKKGYLVVYGIHKKREGGRLQEFIFSSFYRTWNYFADINIPENAGDFSLIDKKVVDIIIGLPEKDVFIRGIRAWAGFPQIGVDFRREKRHGGVSTQNFLSYMSWALFAITSFSTKPLRFVSIFSLVVFILSISYFVVLLGMYFVGIQGPKGFMTLIGVVLLLFSANFFILGVIAEYLIRIFKEVKSRPTAIVETEQKSKVS